MLRRWLLAMITAVTALALAGVDTAASVVPADSYIYDAPIRSRVELEVEAASGSELPQPSNRSVGPFPRSSSLVGAATTFPDACVATNNDEPEKGPVTPARAKELAEAVGYTKTNFRSHGQAVYKKGKSYITRDVDGHCGGVWKEASSPEALGSKATRNGTYNADLTERVGD